LKLVYEHFPCCKCARRRQNVRWRLLDIIFLSFTVHENFDFYRFLEEVLECQNGLLKKMMEDQKDLMSWLKWTAEQNAAIRGDYCCNSCRNCSREFRDFDYENSADGCFKDLIKWLRDIGIDEHSIMIVSF